MSRANKERVAAAVMILLFAAAALVWLDCRAAECERQECAPGQRPGIVHNGCCCLGEPTGDDDGSSR